MHVSILHISDLHRDAGNPIRNGPLLESLRNDHQRYAGGHDSGIRSPDLIVVSGDIVQGVQPGTKDAAASLGAQYEEAHEFLRGLTDAFVGGDPGRVVIVPGNHDVSACHMMESARRVPIAAGRKREIVTQLFSPNSRLRWSWSDLEPYEIFDEDKYAKRLECFADFYGKFYDGARSFSLDPCQQYDVFDFPEFNLVVVGFSSCFNNDILNRQGAIHPVSVSNAGAALRQPVRADCIRVAVWHHNTEGLPMQSDYMDPDMLQHLIDGGFSLGFHGHQHRPQFLDTRFKYGAERRITVISAGTLCGSASFRFARAYNVVELDTDAGSGRLHLREMHNDTLEFPIWAQRPLPPGSGDYLEFKFDPPPAPIMRASDATAALLRAEGLYDSGDYRGAADTLSALASRDEIARRLLVEALHKLGDTQGLIGLLDPPKSAAEAIVLMDALWNEGRRDRLRSLLDEMGLKTLDPSVGELRNKYLARLRA